MTLIQLECFLRAAANRSFTIAAQELFISRQVVSTHVKMLEEELGFSLFQRGGKSIELTAGGKLMFHELSTISQRFHAAVKAAAAQEQEYQDISIGICEMNRDWHTKLYAFTEEHPNCRLNVEVLPLYELEKGLLDDRFDIVFSLNGELPQTNHTRYEFELMAPLQTVIAISRRHPLAQQESLDLPDIQNECLYVLADTYSTRSKEHILGHFDYVGCRPREIREFPNYKSLELSLANGGACIAYDIFLENRGDRLKLYPIIPLAAVHLTVAYKRNSGPLVKELAKLLAE